MKSHDVYSVVTGGHLEGETRVQGHVHLRTLILDEAERCARALFRANGEMELPDILITSVKGTDHTAAEAIKARKMNASKMAPSVLQKIAADAKKIRDARL